MKSVAFSITAIAAITAAAPMKRDAVSGDVAILNYALTLEHLEATFYRLGLKKFSAADFTAAGYSPATYDRFTRIAYDETTHVTFLTGALSAAGAPAVAECTYDFGGGYKDVPSFIGLASVLEGVGVSAYTGAAASIMTKGYLTAAASILAIEARHSSYIRSKLKEVPFPQPFDDPLSLNSVYTLAAPFFVSCPSSNPTLPVKAFPTLKVTCADSVIKTGSVIYLSVDESVIHGKSFYVAFITITGPVFVKMGTDYGVVVPAGIAGQSYVVLTSSSTAATDDVILAGPAIIEIAN